VETLGHQTGQTEGRGDDGTENQAKIDPGPVSEAADLISPKRD
jgi:hypothetical protein